MRLRRWSTTVTISRDRPDGTTVDLDVDVTVWPGERQWFNAMEGVGHPGSGPEPEVEVARLNGVTVKLTDEEIEKAADQAVEQYIDETGDPRY